MGAQLALQAHGFANSADLKPVPRLLLWWMATRALDVDSESGQRARRSFMSRAELAIGLGRFMADEQPGPDAPSEERLEWEKHDQAVKRALAQLKKSGAIRMIRTGHAGRSSEYEICLDRNLSGTQNVPLPGTLSVPVGGRSVTERGVTHRPPKETAINQEETGREQPQPTATTYVPSTRDKAITETTIRPDRNSNRLQPRPGPYVGARRGLETIAS